MRDWVGLCLGIQFLIIFDESIKTVGLQFSSDSWYYENNTNNELGSVIFYVIDFKTGKIF